MTTDHFRAILGDIFPDGYDRNDLPRMGPLNEALDARGRGRMTAKDRNRLWDEMWKENDAADEPEPPASDDAVRVVVMHHTNIQLSTGKIAHRKMAVIPRVEYDAICALDDNAGRPHRLLKVE